MIPPPAPAPITASAPASPAVVRFNAAVHAAYARVRAEQATSPAHTVRQRLERLGELDQAGREALSQLGPDSLSQADRLAAQPGMGEIGRQDLADRVELKGMMPAAGWFTRERYGRKAALAAWLVAEHAPDDPALIRTVLARLRPFRARGGFEAREYAIMSDRVAAMVEHRPQGYGTQVECHAGAWRPMPVAAPARLDARRRAAGFKETEAEYLKTFADEPCR